MTNNNYNIDNRIIPLFNVPITMKNLFDIKTNKNIEINSSNNEGNIQTQNIIVPKKTNIKNTSNLYSKALEKYNNNLNIFNSINFSNIIEANATTPLTKTELIEEIKEENNINKIYNNYLFIINNLIYYKINFL